VAIPAWHYSARQFSHHFHAVRAASAVIKRCSQQLAVVKSTFDFMKPFSMFAGLALASGGSAPSR
jgi:hypothetical protein